MRFNEDKAINAFKKLELVAKAKRKDVYFLFYDSEYDDFLILNIGEHKKVEETYNLIDLGDLGFLGDPETDPCDLFLKDKELYNLYKSFNSKYLEISLYSGH